MFGGPYRTRRPHARAMPNLTNNGSGDEEEEEEVRTLVIRAMDGDWIMGDDVVLPVTGDETVVDIQQARDCCVYHLRHHIIFVRNVDMMRNNSRNEVMFPSGPSLFVLLAVRGCPFSTSRGKASYPVDLPGSSVYCRTNPSLLLERGGLFSRRHLRTVALKKPSFGCAADIAYHSRRRSLHNRSESAMDLASGNRPPTEVQ